MRDMYDRAEKDLQRQDRYMNTRREKTLHMAVVSQCWVSLCVCVWGGGLFFFLLGTFRKCL